jgi:FlaG protein
MNGHLSIAPQPATLDLPPSARRALSGPVQPTTRDAIIQPPAPTTPPVLVPAVARQDETARLRSLLTDPRMHVNMVRDQASGRTVLSVKDATTGEVVDQIPSEELLRLYATMRESLVDERA